MSFHEVMETIGKAVDAAGVVAIDPTYDSVGVLALIVLIRTFLSWSLELEISGSWPWQKEESGKSSADPAT